MGYLKTCSNILPEDHSELFHRCMSFPNEGEVIKLYTQTPKVQNLSHFFNYRIANEQQASREVVYSFSVIIVI